MDFDVDEFDFESKYQDDLDALEDLDVNPPDLNNFVIDKLINPTNESPHVKEKVDSEKDQEKVLSQDNILSAHAVAGDSVENSFSAHNSSLSIHEHAEINTTLENKNREMPRRKRPRLDSGPHELSEIQNFRLNEINAELGVTKTKKVLKRIPAGSYISSTTSDGKRVYLRLLPDEDAADSKQVSSHYHFADKCRLLPVSCADLHMQIENEREAKLMLEIEKMSDTNKSINEARSTPLNSGESKKMISENILWVEKFKPNNYLELLSDDGTNRTLLRWLKLWDKVVFNKEVSTPRLNETEKEKEAQQQNKFKKKSLPDINKELDSFNRPQQKIALLCGPPGLGKTTLAHIIAQHAGYNVVEMNASDDRSPQVFKTQIEAATQMRAVLGQDPRPNCLIIDEIDGAPLPSITYLASMVASKNHDQNKSKTNRRKQAGLLLRPIICICNDQYVPALRPLRTIALVLNFPPTLPTRLASRLLDVSRKQKMKTDTSTLLALCEKADNDIRSCLATLQFIHGKQKELKMCDVHSLSVGHKDIQKNLFSVWQEIFHVPKPKRKRTANVEESNMFLENLGIHSFESVIDESSVSARFHKILRLVQSYGDAEKIHQGLFANYLLMKYRDHYMTTTSLGSEWMCFSDIILQDIQHSQNYNLMGYLPFTSVVFHMIFASSSYMRITFPTAHFEFKSNLTRSENVIITFLNELSPTVRSFVNTSVLVMELLPFLMTIIQPPLRPVNTQLYSNQEKADLNHLIDVMINYNITYQQVLGLDGQYSYKLDPPADLVCTYPDSKSNDLLTYAAKQMIAREVDLEKMRRSDLVRKTEFQEQKALDLEKSKSSKKMQPEIPNHKQYLQPKKIVVEEKPLLDFFGRKIEVKKTPETLNKRATNELGKGDIWYHFKEGYSNAVRKNIRIQDLL